MPRSEVYRTVVDAVMRAAIANHRTRHEDLDLLMREVIRIGDHLRPAGS